MKASNLQLDLSTDCLQNRKKNLQSISIYAINKVWHFLIQFITRSNELRIWFKTDRQGNTTWYVYDPVTGVRASLSSEAELRSWIEQRYYQ